MDIGERNELSPINSAKRDELLNELLAWHKTVNAKLPATPNPDYKPNTSIVPKKKKKE